MRRTRHGLVPPCRGVGSSRLPPPTVVVAARVTSVARIVTVPWTAIAARGLGHGCRDGAPIPVSVLVLARLGLVLRDVNGRLRRRQRRRSRVLGPGVAGPRVASGDGAGGDLMGEGR